MGINLVGIPFDKKSSFMTGPALAPDRIRAVLHSGAGNDYTELGVNPWENAGLQDVGNLAVADFMALEDQVLQVLRDNRRLLTLGGDHSIAYPVIRAHWQHCEPFTLLQIDAHGDLYDNFEGDRFSHACPFARIMEEGLVKRLVQVGVRTLTPHQREQAARFGVETIEMKDYQGWQQLKLDGPLYVSLDLDGLDPAFAPGVSHHEPGGLTARQVLDIIHHLPADVIGADIVEYNPHRDHADMTAALAAKLLKELAGVMLDSRRG